MSGENSDNSGKPSDAPSTPIRKEKKRVVWHSSSNSGGKGTEDAAHDYSTLSPSASPRRNASKSSSVPPGAPDFQELSRKLSQVKQEEEERVREVRLLREKQQQQERQEQEQREQKRLEQLQQQQQQLLPDQDDQSQNPALRRPRPALRRNTSYDAPHEREEADRAEQRTNERTLRSMNDARLRADQLALSLGSHSAPGSRRNSDEVGASFQRLLSTTDGPHRGRGTGLSRPAVVIDDYDDDEEGEPSRRNNTREIQLTTRGSDGGAPAAGAVVDQHVRQRVSHQRNMSNLSEDDPWDEHEVAARIVKSHTRKGKRDLFHHQTLRGRASGTSTPVLQQAYTQDYVPRPKKYRGGILSSLLKLYNDELPASRGGGGSNGSSEQNTPATPTPLMSPQPSPPNSRPGSRSTSRTRAPRSNRSSGLFNLHRSAGSASSLTLTELMKSSSMFAAPGSSEISDRMADKIRKESAPPPPKKKDQIRITVHIAGIIARHRYLMKLCRALMMYGAPTHRLEEYLSMSARVLEIEGQFLYMPSCMIISFDDSTTHTTEVKIVRVPQGIDLGRLRDVHNIYKEVVHDKLGVEEATKRLDEVMQRTPKFNVWFRVFLYGVASACVAPFAFQGRFMDLPLAFLLGCIVGVLQLVFAPSNELYAHVFEVSASVVTSFLARAFGSINGGETFCFSALAQSSIALILPGYMVLCSSLELQSHNIVAGSVRMVHAMIYTLFLGYGITIGASLYGMLDQNADSRTTCPNPLHRNWYFLFVPGFTLCLCLVNQAKWKQTPVMIVMALAGFCTNSYTSIYFNKNTQISNMLGALTVGILANLYSRLGRHVDNAWLDFVEWWQDNVQPRLSRTMRRKNKASEKWALPSDTESRPGSPIEDEKPVRHRRQTGYSLAAAAMLPAIFVQVPSGLAVNGSLLAGITTANNITNGTKIEADESTLGNLDGTAFNVLFSVIQVAIGISVGLFMSALIVYPLGKRRSGLFSF